MNSNQWIKVEDVLPEDGQAVLCCRNRSNWGMSHTLKGFEDEANIWRWVTCRFRSKAPESIGPNNLRSYYWEVFGATKYLWGQDVSHWMPISSPEDVQLVNSRFASSSVALRLV